MAMFRGRTLIKVTHKDLDDNLSYTVPKGTLNIRPNAFDTCIFLSEIHLPKSISVIGQCFDQCDMIQKVFIDADEPEDYERIKAYLSDNMQAIADNTREEIRVRNTISVLGQAARTGFFSRDAKGKLRDHLHKDVLNVIAKELPKIEQGPDIIVEEKAQQIFDQAVELKLPQP